jgi:peptidyl-tRNA hydrolase
MSEPTLYILMRTDLESMNPGKGMAQAAHAANQFVHEYSKLSEFGDWAKQAEGFGTTIVLGGGNEEDIARVASDCAYREGFVAGLVRDPTYPVKDGEAVHLISLVTCAYVFTPCRITNPVHELQDLCLHH